MAKSSWASSSENPKSAHKKSPPPSAMLEFRVQWPTISRGTLGEIGLNIPFNGLGVASAAGYEDAINGQFSGRLEECLTTDRLLTDPLWEQLVHDLMLEVIAAARALGFDIPESLADHQIERTRTMGGIQSLNVDRFRTRPGAGVAKPFLEPLRHAQAKGVKVPGFSNFAQSFANLTR
jgi:2-dehydropantoate 2-reductase